MAHVLAKDLRESVFKFALEGRLSNSSPSIELVSIDDGLFNGFLIPETWDLVTAKESCYIHARVGWQALSKSEHQKTGDYMLITGTDFLNGEINYSTCVYVSKERYEMDTKIQLQNDDILITKDGTLGKVAVVKNLPKPATLNGGVFVIRPDERFNKDYIELIFNSSYFERFINDIKKSTTIKHLNQKKLHSFLIPVPPIEEQALIVAKVNEIMVKIDEYEKLENQLVKLKEQFPQDMKDSLLQAGVMGKLTVQKETNSIDDIFDGVQPNFDEDDSCFDIPDNWCWCYLKDVADILGGFAFKSTNYTKDGIRVIRISDFNENGFVDKNIVKYQYHESLSKYKIQKKDILMCMTGGTVGKNYYIEELNEELLLNQRVADIRSKMVNNDYMNIIIKSPFIQQIINDNKNSTNDNISMNLINRFPTPLPPIEEQQRIVDKLDELLPLVDKLAGLN